MMETDSLPKKQPDSCICVTIYKKEGADAAMKKEKKEKEEILCWEDVRKLPENEQVRWEIADELGLFDKVIESGWKSLTSKESGRIGGIMSGRLRNKKNQ